MTNPMRCAIAVSIIAVSFAVFATSSVASAQTVPHPRLAHAKWVALGYDLGGRVVLEGDERFPNDTTSEDRKALTTIRRLLEKWGRYSITDRAESADLLIAVRIGNLASVGVSKPIGGRGRQGEIQGRAVEARAGSRDDSISVYAASTAGSGAPLWWAQLPNGLSDPGAPLFEELKAAVERAGRQH